MLNEKNVVSWDSGRKILLLFFSKILLVIIIYKKISRVFCDAVFSPFSPTFIIGPIALLRKSVMFIHLYPLYYAKRISE